MHKDKLYDSDMLQKGRPFPSTFWEALLIIAIYFGLLFAACPIMIVMLFTPVSLIHNLSFFIYFAWTGILTCILLFFIKKNAEKDVFAVPKLDLKKWVLALLLILLTITLQQGFILPLTNLIPTPDRFIKALELNNSFEINPLGFMLTSIILAPIIEEFIFRGVLLDGLLKKHSPWKSIFFSAFLFAIIHLNPWQFVVALVLGVLTGWIYYRTHNLLLCILIHMANNAFALFSHHYAEFFFDKSSFNYPLFWVYVTMMLILSALLLFLIKDRLEDPYEEEIEEEQEVE